MKKLSFALVVALLVLVVALSGSAPFSSPDPAEAAQSGIPDYVWINQEKCNEALHALGSSGLGASGVPLTGWYIDAWTATIHVGLIETADEYIEAVRAIVSQFEGISLEFFEPRFTEAELRDLQASIDASLRALPSTADEPDAPLISLTVDLMNNGLFICLREIRPEHIAAIRDLVGDEVPIVFLEGDPVPYRTGTYRPLLGGIKLTTDLGSSTLGFGAEAGGEAGFVMTGHAGWEGDRVWQPTAWLWNRVGQISANPAGPRFSDAAFVPNDDVSAVVWPDRNIVGWEASYDTSVGSLVMKEGITTGFSAGVILQLHRTFGSQPFTMLYNQVVVELSADYGDSGGSVFRVDGEGNAVIVATIMGGWPGTDYAVYSPVEGIVFDLGLDGFAVQGVTGVVYDNYGGNPIVGASVVIDGTLHLVYTGSGGSYTILLGAGTHTVKASYPPWFHPTTYTVQVGYGSFTTLYLGLDPLYPGFRYPQGIDDPAEVTAATG